MAVGSGMPRMSRPEPLLRFQYFVKGNICLSIRFKIPPFSLGPQGSDPSAYFSHNNPVWEIGLRESDRPSVT